MAAGEIDGQRVRVSRADDGQGADPVEGQRPGECAADVDFQVRAVANQAKRVGLAVVSAVATRIGRIDADFIAHHIYRVAAADVTPGGSCDDHRFRAFGEFVVDRRDGKRGRRLAGADRHRIPALWLPAYRYW